MIIAALASLVLGACGGSANPASPQRAGLVILHGDGTLRQACVEFSEPSISGYELLARSGIAVVVDPRNAMGVLVCSIDGEGCSFPQEDCLCACRGTGACTYWAYFVRGADGSWSYSPVGASMRQVSDGDVDAWVWLTHAGAEVPEVPTLPTVDLAALCGPLSTETESR